MKKQPEYNMQVAICNYLSVQYSKVLFLTDTIASVRLTMPQQQRNKKVQKKDFHCPDLLILEPMGNFSGLLIELKTETPFKKDGSIKVSQNDHLLHQQESINKLIDKGYYACFIWSFEEAKKLIDIYLNNKL